MTVCRDDAPESEDALAGRIDSLAESDGAFALYRFPRAGEPVLAIQTDGPAACLQRLSELNGQTGFVFAPFAIGQDRPAVLLKPDIRAAGPDNIASLLARLCLSDRKPCQGPSGTPVGDESDDGYTKYARAFRLFTGALKEKKFEKLVLSRPRVLEKGRCFSAARIFFEACRRYPTAFVYLFHTPVTGTWLGSTPETLLAGEGGCWHTVALAGTRLAESRSGFSFSGQAAGSSPERAAGPDACADAAGWDAKNRREQELVAGYVRELLLARGISWKERGPYPCRAGKVEHLLTDFYFTWPSAGQLGDLVASLHPTPAVCGLPKEKAFRFICRNEGYDRAYYSGFAGWLSPREETGLYVNLRCMRIDPARLTLYAGGGLLPASELDAEWKETDDKLQTLLDLVDGAPRKAPVLS